MNRPMTAAAAVAALLLVAPAAQAQMFKDAALDALYAGERFDELDRAGRQRAADDTQGLLARALAALQANDGARRQAVIEQAEGCVQRQPKAAACHYALGAVLGVHAATEGMMKLASSIGRVKDALHEALALEPKWYAARGAVVEYYALVPGLLGGSTTKALEIARAAPRPEETKALEARVALQDGKAEAALDALVALQPVADSALAADVDAWARQAAFTLLNKGQHARARQHFERVMKLRPEAAYAPYGLGRVLAETGAPAEALKHYDAAAKLKGAGELPIDYRAGLAHQALGSADAARAAFRRFVAAGKGPKSNLDDARKRLEQLGG